MKIAIIVGHPDPSPQRFNRALAERYAKGAVAAGCEVRTIDVAMLDFPLLQNGDAFVSGTVPEPIERAQQHILWADRLVFIFPLWIGDMPAKLKGFLEQTFRPGFALRYDRRRRLPVGMLRGKSARIVVTMGMPALLYRAYFGAHALRAVARNLAFCGVAPVSETLVGRVGDLSPGACNRWLARIERLGRCDARRPRHRGLRRASGAVAACAVAGAAAYLALAAVAWARFGSGARRDCLLDDVMPEYDVRLRHETAVDAPASRTFDAIFRADVDRSPIVAVLFRARRTILGGRGQSEPLPAGLLEQLIAIGWRVIAEEPGRELVFGAVTRPWEPEPRFLGLSSAEFRRFQEPGYVKIAFTLRVDPDGEMRSIAGTQTRAYATDAVSRARFRRYWAFLSPGIQMVRIVLLAQLRADAEAAAQREAAVAD